MKPNIRKVKKYRRYSQEFKQSIVDSFESGSSSTKELSLQNNIGQAMIYKWIYKLSKYNKEGYRVVEKVNSKESKIKELEEQNRSLKAMIGDKQIRIEYLEKLISLAEEDLKIDIKKNSSTLQSNTLEKRKKK